MIDSTQSTTPAATPAAAPAADANPGVIFNFEKIYIKDMSIEIPHAPQIFLEQEAPALETSLNITADSFAEGMYEVVVTATATTRIKDKVVFLVEVAQAGIFEIRNFPADQIAPMVEIHCAGVLFPYLRANVSDVVTRAGFPALLLPTINFEALYAQRIGQTGQAQAKGETAGPIAIVTPAAH